MAFKHSTSIISPICTKCQGKHWNPDSQKATQEAVLKEFGVIPNDCVNGEGNGYVKDIHCPYATK